jgi:tetratricopeptide (TPR) repeat protein
MSTAAVAAPPPALGPEPPPGAAALPYKFLDYFEESDEPNFAGRDRDIADVVARIACTRTLVLFGRSGLGKTSLLKAGIFPRLRERGCLPVYVRTLTDPLPDLLSALAAEAVKKGLAPEGAGASATLEQARGWIAGLAEAGPVVLVLDQFEEFFIRFRERKYADARAALVAGLGALVDDLDLDLRVVLSLREDYLAELEAFNARLPGLLDNRYRLGPLTAFGAREAIVRPLRHGGVPHSLALVTRLVDLLGGDVGYDPSRLQIACTEVFRQAVRRDAAHVHLKDDDLKKVGGLDGILRRYLDAVTGTIPREDLLVTRTILDTLITHEGTKRATNLASLADADFRASEDEIDRVLRVLEARRLVRREVRDGQPWYELIHERLVRFVREWLDLDKDFLNFRIARDLVTNSSRGERWRDLPDTLLNRGQVEGVVGPYRDRLRLDRTQTEFLLRSALYSRTREVAFWAERFGHEESIAILLDALGRQDDLYCLGAATVAGQFPDPDGRIAAACLALGSDPSEEIRRAAGRSLSLLRKAAPRRRPRLAPPPASPPAGPPGLLRRKLPVLTALAHRLADPAVDAWRHRRDSAVLAWRSFRRRGILGTLDDVRLDLVGHRPELEMLAAMALEGDRLAEFPFWQRVRARRRAAAWFRKENATAIGAQRRAGALGGAIAGFLWTVTLGAALLLFARTLGRVESGSEPGGSSLGYLAGPLAGYGWLAVIAGTIIGALAATTAAQEVIRRDDQFHPFRLARSKLLVAAVGLLSLITITISSESLYGHLFESLQTIGLSLTLAFLFGAAAVVALEGGATLALRCVDARNRLESWAWPLLAGAAFPFCAYAVANVLLCLTMHTWPAVTAYVAIGASYGVTVVAAARANAARRMAIDAGESEPGRPPSRAARRACVAAGVAMIPLFWLSWGFDTFSLFGRTVVVPESGVRPMSAALGPAAPDLAHVNLRSERDALVSVRTASTTAQLVLLGEGRDALLRPGARIIVPRGTHHLVFGRRQSSGSAPLPLTDRYAAELEPVALPSATDAAVPEGAGPHLVHLVLTESRGAGKESPFVWTASLRGTRPVDDRGEGITVTLYPSLSADLSATISEPTLVSGAAVIDGGKVTWPGPGQAEAQRMIFLNRPQDLVEFHETALDAIRVEPEIDPRGQWRIDLRIEADQPASLAHKVAILARVERSRREETPTTESVPADDPGQRVARAVAEAGPFEKQGDWTRAIAIYRQVLDLAPQSALLRFRLSDALENRGDLGAAAEEARQAVEIEPENATYRNNLAWILCLAGRYEEALPHARAAVEKNKGDLNTLDTLAHAAFGTGHWAEAVDAWAEVDRRVPGYFSDPSHANCAEDRAHYGEARRRAVEADRGAVMARAEGFETQKRWNDAIETYRQLLGDGPESAPLRMRLAAALRARGDLGAAVAEAQKAVELDPGEASSRKELARWLCLAGRFEEALPPARRAAQLEPEDRDSQDTLAHAAFGVGRWAEAARAWAEVERLDPQFLKDPGRPDCAEDGAHYAEAQRRVTEADRATPADPP